MSNEEQLSNKPLNTNHHHGATPIKRTSHHGAPPIKEPNSLETSTAIKSISVNLELMHVWGISGDCKVQSTKDTQRIWSNAVTTDTVGA